MPSPSGRCSGRRQTPMAGIQQPGPRAMVRDLARGKVPHRPIIAPLVFTLAAKVEGIPPRAFLSNPTKLSNSLKHVHDFLRPDAVVCHFGTCLEAEAMGCQLNWSTCPPTIACSPYQLGKPYWQGYLDQAHWWLSCTAKACSAASRRGSRTLKTLWSNVAELPCRWRNGSARPGQTSCSSRSKHQRGLVRDTSALWNRFCLLCAMSFASTRLYRSSASLHPSYRGNYVNSLGLPRKPSYASDSRTHQVL